MRRRAFLYGGLGTLAACTQPSTDELPRSASETHSWRLVTSWPPNFPGFGSSANRLAERIGELSVELRRFPNAVLEIAEGAEGAHSGIRQA